MAKAVLITTSNQPALANRYNIETEDRDDMMPVGYYLVVKTFGDDHNYDVVDRSKLDSEFVETGVKLENEWFEIVGHDGSHRTD